MRIAMLISGRATSYETCLLPILEKEKNIKVDLFMAINNVNCEYFDIMKEKLREWLVYYDISEFQYPPDFICENKETDKLQRVGDKFIPYNALSMFYHDNKSFNMATKYADENSFEYDYYLKYRSDVNDSTIPLVEGISSGVVYCAKPLAIFEGRGLHKKNIVSDAIAFGNRDAMSVYCNTYDFLIKKNVELGNTYYIAYEDTLTDCLIENNITYEYRDIKYSLDFNRRMFDKMLSYRDSNNNIQRDLGCTHCKDDSNGLVNYDIKNIKGDENIPVKKRVN